MKVVDRRRVDEAGEERNNPESEVNEHPAKPAAESAPSPEAQGGTSANATTAGPQDSKPESGKAESGKAAPGKAESGKAAPEIDFSTFVQSLGQQALMHLGLIPWPEDGQRHREMALAKQTIDILNMLHEKTKGNLSADEQKLFEALLHDLRMVFIQVKQ